MTPFPLTAVYNAAGLAYYRHPDWLGSSRFASTPSRTVYSDGAYAPFGENYAETGTQDREFAGMNQDTVSTGPYPLYDALYREYHPTWGRWLTPDPAGLAAANPADPQTWNRYAYVTNNPLALTDPLGLDAGCPDHSHSIGPGQCEGYVAGGEARWPWYWVIDEFDTMGNLGQGDCNSVLTVDAGCGHAGTRWPNGQSIYGDEIGVDTSVWPDRVSGPWSENPGISLTPNLTLWQLLGFPQPQTGCEFGPCDGGLTADSFMTGKDAARAALLWSNPLLGYNWYMLRKHPEWKTNGVCGVLVQASKWGNLVAPSLLLMHTPSHIVAGYYGWIKFEEANNCK